MIHDQTQCNQTELTFREGGLIDHRAPGAGQLINVKANGKFILCVGLQISHQEALLTPAEEYI